MMMAQEVHVLSAHAFGLPANHKKCSVFFLCTCTKNAKIRDVCHWKVETYVFQFSFKCFSPALDPRCLVNNEMSLHTYTTFVKGNLGQGGVRLEQTSTFR